MNRLDKFIAIFKRKPGTLEVNFQKTFSAWEKKYMADNFLEENNSLTYLLEEKVNGIIIEQLELEVNKEMISKIAKEFMDKYDFDKAIKQAMHDKITECIKAVVSK